MLDRIDRSFKRPSELRAVLSRPVQRASSRRGLVWALIGCIVVIVVLLVVAGFLLWRSLQKESDADISKRIITQVSKIYLTPSTEEAVVARVQDRAKLDSQPFYKDAQNGDYLLIYNKAKLALIYREKDHKVIIAAPIQGKTEQLAPSGRK